MSLTSRCRKKVRSTSALNDLKTVTDFTGWVVAEILMLWAIAKRRGHGAKEHGAKVTPKARG